MTIDNLIAVAFKRNPGMRFAKNKHENAIAQWDSNRWSACASQGIDGRWYAVDEAGLCANGQAMWPQGDWVEVPNV